MGEPDRCLCGNTKFIDLDESGLFECYECGAIHISEETIE